MDHCVFGQGVAFGNGPRLPVLLMGRWVRAPPLGRRALKPFTTNNQTQPQRPTTVGLSLCRNRRKRTYE